MKILVITACTADKNFVLPNQLQPENCDTPGRLKLKSKKLKAYETRAAEMYTGDGHKRLMDGVKNLQDTFGQGIVDVRIISPAYGVLNEKDWIVPYNYDFSDYPNWKIEQRSRKLKIHPKIGCSLSRYDLAFFLLSEKYIIACLPCRLPFDVNTSVVQIFLASKGAQKRIPPNQPYVHAVHTEELVAPLAGATPFNVKEVVFERLCKVACARGLEVFEEVKQNPQKIIKMVLECNRGL